MIKKSNWITPPQADGAQYPYFIRNFEINGTIKKATLEITSKGVYVAKLNGQRIGNFVMAPGWTSYEKRHQYQTYDVTDMLKKDNELSVMVGNGWQRGKISQPLDNIPGPYAPPAIIGVLVLEYENGNIEYIKTDSEWIWAKGQIVQSDIFDGEIYDATKDIVKMGNCIIYECPKDNLIPQEGEIVIEHEIFRPLKLIKTPKGETVIDFGQNLTGYPEVTLTAEKGDRVDLSFGEVLDSDGNFYNANYRTADCTYTYICKDGCQSYKPNMTFYGFRYIRVNSFPGEISKDNFKAIAVYSDIKQTGFITSGNEKINKLISNVYWGQRDNFLDIPTDCPQRDERLGWTGDIQVFSKAACYNFDVEKFLSKWLSDLVADQYENGRVPDTIPKTTFPGRASTAWGDAATVVPWNVYLAYGNTEILEKTYDSMCKWVSFMTNETKDEYLWTGGEHYGDWLALDAPEGDRVGSSRVDFIASAFYAYSTSIVIKAGKVLGKDVEKYEKLYNNIKEKFIVTFPEYFTQTECVLALHFDLVTDREKCISKLVDMIEKNGNKLTTGFVGTPYLLHVLSSNGRIDVAYKLLMQEENPSWLYSVNMGATTIWEHWDGINEKGEFWSDEMNSYNHYAYGSVIDWIYSVAGGIRTDEEFPGYEKVIIAPNPSDKLGYLETKFVSRKGEIISRWEYVDGVVKYTITTPVEATVIIGGKEHKVTKGKYIFYN